MNLYFAFKNDLCLAYILQIPSSIGHCYQIRLKSHHTSYLTQSPVRNPLTGWKREPTIDQIICARNNNQLSQRKWRRMAAYVQQMEISAPPTTTTTTTTTTYSNASEYPHMRWIVLSSFDDQYTAPNTRVCPHPHKWRWVPPPHQSRWEPPPLTMCCQAFKNKTIPHVKILVSKVVFV